MPTHTPNDLALVYFDEPKRAEPIRYILAYGKIAFKDVRIPLQDYAATKSSLDLPFGQVPTLSVNGTTYAQSVAIARYVAKLAGLYPTDPLVALEADAIVDAALEVTLGVVFLKFSPDPVKALDNLNNVVFPRILNGLEKRVVGPYFAGENVTFADLFWLNFYIHKWLPNLDTLTASPDDFPKLKAIATTLQSCNELAEYFAKQTA
ncbi:Aste57867_12009 [Aphanomyces stellatus]|uniref:Aste57867_12009 protein n=1 Tax=Aphanomyces stellatus TaxID=120398 RepID=A0A485KV20_9STRA|nr:hypothetical protein As57867_011964 [Aphanomyces stellatus]VFT88864.1 Aste57867_12009 [Aphanomyces stellatus]